MDYYDLIKGSNLKPPRFLIMKFLIIYPALNLTIIFPINFLEFFSPNFGLLSLFLIFPWFLLYYWSIFLFSLLFFAKLYLILIDLLHKPKEGLFSISLRDKDYLFYVLRKVIKKLILQLYNYYPLPWLKILALKVFNIKIPANVGILDSYIDSDFIEFGSETILGEGAIILSSIIIGDKLMVKKTVIGERTTIGAYSVISPGTVVEKGAILGMGSSTKINQHLETGWIYVGRPAQKLKKQDDQS
ncbi:MAG: hypothetical protein BAJALOKI1v1_210023 [Promethearchaeota archaeon]|nr:MAG: hypothetical protein BAJALOKI1v1_210023 [Candidatus Lokiarchaeota archaeon]